MTSQGLRRCLNECCFFIDGQPAKRPEYEEALRLHSSFFGASTSGEDLVVETIITCRRIPLQQVSVEELKRLHAAIMNGDDCPYSSSAVNTEMHRRGLQ
jgi:hypothetical protein